MGEHILAFFTCVHSVRTDKFSFTRTSSGHRGISHPRTQDSLLPICYRLMNTETDSRVKWLLEMVSQCVWRGVGAAGKRPAIKSVQVKKWCLRDCVLCVGNCTPTTTTADTTNTIKHKSQKWFASWISYEVKQGKSVQLEVWSDPEGSRKLRFPDFMTTAQDSGKVVSLSHRPPLPLGNTPGTHFC